jgi:tryptophan synthase alpha chain
MSAVDQLFTNLRNSGRKALMPFFTSGDPDMGTTASVIRAAQAAGADLCEVGVPYSDPIADGPVIQASYQRSLNKGFRLQQVFDLGGRLAKYVQQAKAAGYAGAIVPDLLVEEAGELSKICRDADFSLIQLVTPTTPRPRQVQIAESSSGFLYYVSVTGITGERTKLPTDLVENVTWLRGQTKLPICIGFGISGPETAAKLAPVADGLIVGSAMVRRVAEASDQSAAVTSVTQFVRELRQAMDAV